MNAKPYKKIHGSAFQNNYLNATRPIANYRGRSRTNVVSLTEWCDKNFVSKNVGRKLIERKYLIAFRRHHVWWVCTNPDCLNELLEYLGVEQLAFDAENE